MRIKQLIRFNGFYDSIHTERIESDIELYFNGDVEKIDNLNINYNKLFNEYSKALVSDFNKFIIEEYKLNLNMEFVELLSPRYYNYSTDQLVVNCDNRLSKLYIKLIKDGGFIEYIKSLTFYKISDFKKSFYKWDEYQKSILLDYVMEGFEDTSIEFNIFNISNWFNS